MSLYRPCCYLLDAGTSISRILNPLKGQRGAVREKFLCSDRWLSVRSFKERGKTRSFAPTPVEPVYDPSSLSLKILFKPLLFTVGFSTTTFVGCTIWQYESVRAKAIQQSIWMPSSWFPTEKKRADWRQQCNDYWNQLSEGQKLFAPVLLANILVFAAWRVPKFQPTMLMYFASNPAAKVLCWPMILSAFSHYSFFHLAANMFVLHSFCHSFVGSLGKEQAAALYLSAGVISSFSSFLHKVITAQPGLSVGASGAIMAILGFICTQYPDAKLSIILLPMFTFSAGAAIKVVVGVDLLGCLLGWRFFDHAAHLGGALTGICWAYWGNTYIWPLREPILRFWHEIRESSA